MYEMSIKVSINYFIMGRLLGNLS